MEGGTFVAGAGAATVTALATMPAAIAIAFVSEDSADVQARQAKYDVYFHNPNAVQP